MTKPKLVRLTSGELLECDLEDERGVHTDAGIIEWGWVLGFLVWSETYQKYMSIPL